MYARRALSPLDQGDFELRSLPYQGGLGGITGKAEPVPYFIFLYETTLLTPPRRGTGPQILSWEGRPEGRVGQPWQVQISDRDR